MSEEQDLRAPRRLKHKSRLVLGLLLLGALPWLACSGGGGGFSDMGIDSQSDGSGSLADDLETSSSSPVYLERLPAGRIRTVRGSFPGASASPETAATDFMDRFRDTLEVPDGAEFFVLRSAAGGLPGTVVRLGVTFEDVPVFGAEVSVHVSSVSVIDYVHLSLPNTVSVPTVPELSATRAENAALNLVGAGASVAAAGELVIYNTGMLTREDGMAHLAWSLTTTGDSLDDERAFLIDAASGEVLLSTPTVTDALARRIYDIEGQSNAGSIYPQRNGFLAYDEAGPRGDGSHADAAKAFALAGEIYGYFLDHFGYDSFDDLGSTMELFVRFQSLNRAGQPQHRAAFSEGLRSFWFTEGMVALDVVAHELTHALIFSASGLVYLGEPGAVHESIADTFAAFIDPDNPWQLGDDSADGIVRDMYDPTRYDQPRQYQDRSTPVSSGACASSFPSCPGTRTCLAGRCVDLSNDNGFVHTNSGILNHAAYLFVAGGTHADTGVVVEGVGEELAEQIYFTAVTFLLGRLTDFADLRSHLRFTCQALIGAQFGTRTVTPQTCGSLTNAFAAVGIGSPDQDNDSWDDEEDNCPTVSNYDQADTHGDTAGDACEASLGEFPQSPLSEPTCPEAYYFYDVVDQETLEMGAVPYPLLRQEPVFAYTYSEFQTHPEFQVYCFYAPEGHQGEDGFRVILQYQPYDPRDYDIAWPSDYTFACSQEETHVEGFLGPYWSNTHIMAVYVSGAGPSEAEAQLRAEYVSEAFQAMAPHALPCPADLP
ncbi:MAG: M4 family metallopeptidase [Myxococcales bacterium]|nr:M4 family metallopeptidase [Myxococcales bacterium]